MVDNDFDEDTEDGVEDDIENMDGWYGSIFLAQDLSFSPFLQYKYTF